jgi:hypothetical protein
LQWHEWRVARRGARFRRNGDGGMWSYVQHAMTYVFDIDPRIVRFCLHAGRLHAGT